MTNQKTGRKRAINLQGMIMVALVVNVCGFAYAESAFNVTYTNSRSSSYGRTVGDKLDDYVSALDFIPNTLHAGIFNGSNSTDLTLYIANAITALGAKGGTIFFPAGEYKCNVTVASDLNIIGEGIGSTVFVPATNDAVFKTPTNKSTVRISFQNLSIKGVSGTQQDGIRLKADAEYFVNLVSIENVKISDCGRYGIYAFGSSTSTPFVQAMYISRALITDNTNSGLFIDGLCLESSIINSFVVRNGTATDPNIYFKSTASGLGVKRFTFLNTAMNNFNNKTTGTVVKLEHATEVTFLSCDFESGKYMIHTTGSLSRNLSVQNCNFSSAADIEAAIWLQNCDAARISNNSFLCNTSMNYAIYSGGMTKLAKAVNIGVNRYSANVATPVKISNNLKITSGYINAYQKYIRLQPETGRTDDLVNIYDRVHTSSSSSLQAGETITLRNVNAADAITIKHDVGNILLKAGQDILLDEKYKSVTLKWDKDMAYWFEL